MSTTREDILNALSALMGQAMVLSVVPIDEPEPSRWEAMISGIGGQMQIQHAMAIQDGPPPDVLSFVRGPDDDACEELELEAVVAYAVQVKPAAGYSPEDSRRERRVLRDEAVKVIAHAIAVDRTLGLGGEVYADVRPAARDDDVAFANAIPTATALVPIHVLYTAAHAAG